MSATRNETPQLQSFFEERTPVRETPSEKYAAYYKLIHSNGLAKLPRTYFTTTITSGGFNVFSNQPKPETTENDNLDFFHLVLAPGEMKTKTPTPTSLSFPEILAENVALAEAFRIGLLDSGKVSTEKSLLIFPPDLGKVPGWTQFDYNLFWLNIISGLNPRDANEIETAFKKSKLDFETYNNGKLSNDIRKKIYLEFVQDYLRLIEQNNFIVDPISEFIQLVDPKGSLGGFVEEFLARSLGVNISRAVINNMESFPKKTAARNLIKSEIEIPAARLSNEPGDVITLVSQPQII